MATALIDVHAHVFNASDLPARKFLEVVFLHLYPESDLVRYLDLSDHDVVDWLLQLFLHIMGADGAPTASDEIAVLTGKKPPAPEFSDFHAADERSIARIADFLHAIDAPSGSTFHSRSTDSNGARALRDAIVKAGTLSTGVAQPHVRPAVLLGGWDAIARRAYFSAFDVGVYLRWFTLFTVYRYALADKLAADHEAQGFAPLALAPALVDFSEWLGQPVSSPLADQVAVMGYIALRPNGPAVHGYVAYDPLRQILAPSDPSTPSPLDLVRSAIVDHGFAGVKLYPPMGFKPADNRDGDPYPPGVTALVPSGLGERLNDALEQLYVLCEALEVPILAHAADNNGAGRGFADRADPAYWKPVFENHPQLRVCLAHFGQFDAPSVDAPAGSQQPESTWEWAMGADVALPAGHVFVDLAYFDGILTADSAGRARLAKYFVDFAARFDPRLEHLMFGTDWIMLGIKADYPTYTSTVADFLAKDCGFAADAVGRLLHGNAMRFLGLRPGDPTRARLDDFYTRNGVRSKLSAM